MDTAGTDKGVQYATLTPEEVIAALHSHAMGLTNTEASRRLAAQGSNTLPSIPVPGHLQQLRQLVHPLQLMAIGVGLILAVYVQTASLLIGLLIVLILQLINLLLDANDAQNRTPAFNNLLPDRTRVFRNDQTTIIPTDQLVVGDLIDLRAGEIVPADVRLLTAKHLVTNDAHLFDTNHYTPKFNHTLSADVPLVARNNMAFAGTSVVTGEARGIVIATGAQTEIGRIIILASSVPKARTSIERFASQQRALIMCAVYGGTVLCFVLGMQSGAAVRDILLTASTLLAVGSAMLIPLVRRIVSWRARTQLNVGGITTKKMATVERMAGVDLLLFNPATFKNESVMVSELLIGREHYTITGNGYEPTGNILTAQGKHLTKKALHDLSLVFEAASLAQTAAVLPPDNQHASWYVYGDPVAGALVTAARRAGQNTEKLDSAYRLIRELPPTSQRHIQTSIRSVGDDTLMFVSGEPSAVTSICTKLWDHGHLRNLSDGDKRYVETHQIRASTAGRNCIAVAYRILPKRTATDTNPTGQLEQKATFLGMFDLTYEAHDHTTSLLNVMRHSSLKVALLLNRPQAYAISSAKLAQWSDRQLVNRIMNGSATFSQLSPVDTLRLVRAAQAMGHSVGISTAALAELPAALAADAVITTTTIPWLAQADTVQVKTPAAIVAAPHVSRALVTNQLLALQATLIMQVAVLGFVIICAVASLVGHIPLGIDIFRVLLLILCPIAPIVFAWNLPSGGTAHAQNWFKQKNRWPTTILLGGMASIIVFATYVWFFARTNVSPVYLDPSSQLQTRASTISFATIIIMQLLTVFMIQSERFATIPLWRLWTPAHSVGLVITGALLGLCLYGPALQATLHTQALDGGDWLSIAVGVVLYSGVLLFERFNRKHARHAIVQLHRDTFGTSSAIKI